MEPDVALGTIPGQPGLPSAPEGADDAPRLYIILIIALLSAVSFAVMFETWDAAPAASTDTSAENAPLGETPAAEPGGWRSTLALDGWGRLTYSVLGLAIALGGVAFGLTSPISRDSSRQVGPFILGIGFLALFIGVVQFHRYMTFLDLNVYGPLVFAEACFAAFVALRLRHTELVGRHLASVIILGVNIVVALAIFVFVNMIGHWKYHRWDLTTEGLYSLSQRSTDIVRSLPADKPITIYNIMERSAQYYEETDELLHRYDESSEHLTVERIDPMNDQERMASLMREVSQRVPNEGFLLIRAPSESRVISQSDLTRQDWGDNMASPEPRSRFQGESKITSSIVELTSPRRTVYFLTGHGEGITGLEEGGEAPPPTMNLRRDRSFRMLVEFLRRSYFDVRGYNPAEHGGAFVPESPDDVLVILAPQFRFSEAELAALGSWLDHGGRLLLLLEAGTEDERTPANTGIETLLEPFGIHPMAGYVGTPTRGGGAVLEGFARVLGGEHEITTPWTGSLALMAAAYRCAMPLRLDDTSPMGATAKQLLFVDDVLVVNIPLTDLVDPGPGPFTLAAAAERPATGGAEGAESRIVVFGDATTASDELLRAGDLTVSLLLNSMNWLAARTQLITIEPKEPDQVQVSLTSEQAGRLTAVAIFDIPLFFVAAGLVVWLIRRG